MYLLNKHFFFSENFLHFTRRKVKKKKDDWPFNFITDLDIDDTMYYSVDGYFVLWFYYIFCFTLIRSGSSNTS